jgi:hypothetical protein
MAMVEDLKRNGDAIAASTIVAAVAGHPGSRQGLAQAVTDLEPSALDERPASEDYLVLDADSTRPRSAGSSRRQWELAKLYVTPRQAW